MDLTEGFEVVRHEHDRDVNMVQGVDLQNTNTQTKLTNTHTDLLVREGISGSL